MRLIDADALYERACELEAQALEYVGKIIHDDEKIEEWRKWSAILNERTAFKHDVYDAPIIEPERKKGQWSNYKDEHCCSICKCVVISDCWDDEIRYDYCPYCGAEME